MYVFRKSGISYITDSNFQFVIKRVKDADN